MKDSKIKYINQKFVVQNAEGEKLVGTNLIGMLMFYCKEQNIELTAEFEINYEDFLKQYHQLTFQKLQKGEVWTIKLKIPNDNPEIKFLTKNLPDIFFDKNIAQEWAHGYQKDNTIPGAIFSVENVSIGYKLDTK